jgi:importin subunit beta-1
MSNATAHPSRKAGTISSQRTTAFKINPSSTVEVERTTKPQIIQTLADVAIALGPAFERYLPHVMTMLISASQAKCDDEDYDTQEYILMLREAVLEAYSSIVTFLGEKSGVFAQFIEPICAFLDLLASEPEREETILRLATGLVGDLADRLGKPAAQFLSRPSVKKIIEETAQNPDGSIRELAMRAQQELTKLCS